MKMKTYIYAVLCVMILALVFVNCADDELEKTSTQPTEMKDFTLQEAKDFFKKQIESKAAKTRVIRKHDRRSLCPDDFVPNWDAAEASSQGDLASYDIPIQTSIRYKALACDFTGGQASAYEVDAPQKLIIVKDTKTGLLGQYILTLIPDKECNARYKKEICDKFINCSDKGQFTGVAIYTNPQNNMIVRANRYEKGEKVQGVFLPGDKETLVERAKILESIIGGLILKQMPAISTRSFGEGGYDNWGDDYWNDNNNYPDNNYPDNNNPDIPGNDDEWIYEHYINMGGGFFIDMVTGTVLIDTNGDGKPDSVWLPEVDITPDPDNNPDPKPDPKPDDPIYVCPHCGSHYCDGSCVSTPPEPGQPDSGDQGNINYIELGREGLNKMRSDLESGNVQIQQVKMSQGQAVLTAVGVGFNTNGIITSCLNFLNQANLDKLAIKFGNTLGAAGIAVGACQTYVAFTDGDISNADIVGAVSTTLSAVGYALAFCPATVPLAGVVGVTGCVLGLISSMMTTDVPILLELQLENGSNLYIYIPAQNCPCA